MAKLNMRLPNYEKAEVDIMRQAIDALNLGQFARLLSSRQTSHAGPIRNIRLPVPIDHPLQAVQEKMEVPLEVIEGTDIDEFMRLVYNLAEGMMKQQAQMFFKTIDDVTSSTGNAIDAKGQELSWDLIIDMFERLEVQFDELGNHNMAIIMHPNMAQKLHSLPMSIQQQRRFDAVMEKKREEYYAQKRTRKIY